VKATAIILATCLFAACAYATPKDKIIGKQVRLPHHKLGVVVGRAGEGFIIMPADKVQGFPSPTPSSQESETTPPSAVH
jgi:hypothetical protein